MGKETPYMRLKRELLGAKRDLWEVVLNPKSDKSIIISRRVILEYRIERAIWTGSVNIINNGNQV